jgi:Tol biopolymer transport system component
VFDRQTNTTERVSVASDGTEGNSFSFSPEISADGRFVTYYSSASNLVPGDTNDTSDIFLFDRQTNTTERVSVASDGTEGNDSSSVPAISADGRLVTYQSVASNLVPGDTNGTYDIFLFDQQTNTTERLSVARDGTEGNDSSFTPAISADGRFVTYYSYASTLVPGDTNGAPDIFVVQTALVDGVVKDGDEGDNVLRGTRRDDILRGHGGNDLLFGAQGDDILDGGTGDDKVFGGAGDDTVAGGEGNDQLRTGKGMDLVIFNEGDGRDLVLDFDHNFDRVQLGVSIGTNSIDDFDELQSLIASGDIDVSTGRHSLMLTFDNGDSVTLRGVQELSANDWLFI